MGTGEILAQPNSTDYCEFQIRLFSTYYSTINGNWPVSILTESSHLEPNS